MKVKQLTHINNLKELRQEKLRLKVLAEKESELMNSDWNFIKEKYNPTAILNRAAQVVVPEQMRFSNLINDPINFIARRVFKKEEDVVSPHSDQGPGNVIRNIALGLGEGLAAYLFTRFIKRKIF